MYQFTDSEFMSSKEKELVLVQWEVFLKNGLQKKHFTDRLYKHLTLHCSFIAHYSIHGFYSSYFERPAGIDAFLSQFDRERGAGSVEYGGRNWLDGEYEDINNALVAVAGRYKESIYQKTAERKEEIWALFLQSVEQAKADPAYREELLQSLRLV